MIEMNVYLHMDRVYTKFLCRVKNNWDQVVSDLLPFKDKLTPVSRGYLVTSKVNEFFRYLVSFRRKSFEQEERSRCREPRIRRLIHGVSFFLLLSIFLISLSILRFLL